MNEFTKYLEHKKRAMPFFTDPNAYGTQDYHAIMLLKRFVATDGVKLMADRLNCYWLLDIVCSYSSKIKGQGIRSAIFLHDGDVDNGTFYLFDEDDVLIVQQEVPYTDIAHSVHLFLAPTVLQGREHWVVMLPSEY